MQVSTLTQHLWSSVSVHVYNMAERQTIWLNSWLNIEMQQLIIILIID